MMIARTLTYGKGLPWPESIRTAFRDFKETWTPSRPGDLGYRAFADFLHVRAGVPFARSAVYAWLHGAYIPSQRRARDGLRRAFNWGDVELPAGSAGMKNMPDGWETLGDRVMQAYLTVMGELFHGPPDDENLGSVSRLTSARPSVLRLMRERYGVSTDCEGSKP